MAKKSRTPPPPRRVQAPKVRTDRGRAGGFFADRTRVVLGVFALTGVLGAAAAVAILVAFGGGGGTKESDLSAAWGAAGCTYKLYKDLGQQHVNSTKAKVKYNSFPPTSGPHYQYAMPWNSYPTEVSQVQLVHNLEHGGIAIQYGSKVPQSEVDKLNAFVDDDPRGMILAPLPRLGGTIAVTAWRRLAKCRRFDEKAYKTFRDARRARGPERFDLAMLGRGE